MVRYQSIHGNHPDVFEGRGLFSGTTKSRCLPVCPHRLIGHVSIPVTCAGSVQASHMSRHVTCPGKSRVQAGHVSRQVTCPGKSRVHASHVSRQVTCPGKSCVLALSRQVTCPGKSRVQAGHVSRQVTCPGYVCLVWCFSIFNFLYQRHYLLSTNTPGARTVNSA